MKVVFASDNSGGSTIDLKKIDALVLCGDCNVAAYKDAFIDVCFFEKSNSEKLHKLKKVKSAVSCGMQEFDSVTFSSISGDSALVCIRREITAFGIRVYPCEFKTFFDSSMSIYNNLVISLLSYFCKEKLRLI